MSGDSNLLHRNNNWMLPNSLAKFDRHDPTKAAAVQPIKLGSQEFNYHHDNNNNDDDDDGSTTSSSGNHNVETQDASGRHDKRTTEERSLSTDESDCISNNGWTVASNQRNPNSKADNNNSSSREEDWPIWGAPPPNVLAGSNRSSKRMLRMDSVREDYPNDDNNDDNDDVHVDDRTNEDNGGKPRAIPRDQLTPDLIASRVEAVLASKNVSPWPDQPESLRDSTQTTSERTSEGKEPHVTSSHDDTVKDVDNEPVDPHYQKKTPGTHFAEDAASVLSEAEPKESFSVIPLPKSLTQVDDDNDNDDDNQVDSRSLSTRHSDIITTASEAQTATVSAGSASTIQVRNGKPSPPMALSLPPVPSCRNLLPEEEEDEKEDESDDEYSMSSSSAHSSSSSSCSSSSSGASSSSASSASSASSLDSSQSSASESSVSARVEQEPDDLDDDDDDDDATETSSAILSFEEMQTLMAAAEHFHGGRLPPAPPANQFAPQPLATSNKNSNYHSGNNNEQQQEKPLKASSIQSEAILVETPLWGVTDEQLDERRLSHSRPTHAYEEKSSNRDSPSDGKLSAVLSQEYDHNEYEEPTIIQQLRAEAEAEGTSSEEESDVDDSYYDEPTIIRQLRDEAEGSSGDEDDSDVEDPTVIKQLRAEVDYEASDVEDEPTIIRELRAEADEEDDDDDDDSSAGDVDFANGEEVTTVTDEDDPTIIKQLRAEVNEEESYMEDSAAHVDETATKQQLRAVVNKSGTPIDDRFGSAERLLMEQLRLELEQDDGEDSYTTDSGSASDDSSIGSASRDSNSHSAGTLSKDKYEAEESVIDDGTDAVDEEQVETAHTSDYTTELADGQVAAGVSVPLSDSSGRKCDFRRRLSKDDSRCTEDLLEELRAELEGDTLSESDEEELGHLVHRAELGGIVRPSPAPTESTSPEPLPRHPRRRSRKSPLAMPMHHNHFLNASSHRDDFGPNAHYPSHGVFPRPQHVSTHSPMRGISPLSCPGSPKSLRGRPLSPPTQSPKPDRINGPPGRPETRPNTTRSRSPRLPPTAATTPRTKNASPHSQSSYNNSQDSRQSARSRQSQRSRPSQQSQPSQRASPTSAGRNSPTRSRSPLRGEDLQKDLSFSDLVKVSEAASIASSSPKPHRREAMQRELSFSDLARTKSAETMFTAKDVSSKEPNSFSPPFGTIVEGVETTPSSAANPFERGSKPKRKQTTSRLPNVSSTSQDSASPWATTQLGGVASPMGNEVIAAMDMQALEALTPKLDDQFEFPEDPSRVNDDTECLDSPLLIGEGGSAGANQKGKRRGGRMRFWNRRGVKLEG